MSGLHGRPRDPRRRFEPGPFIQKPFGADQLARRVREVLDLELPPV